MRSGGSAMRSNASSLSLSASSLPFFFPPLAFPAWPFAVDADAGDGFLDCVGVVLFASLPFAAALSPFSLCALDVRLSFPPCLPDAALCRRPSVPLFDSRLSGRFAMLEADGSCSSSAPSSTASFSLSFSFIIHTIFSAKSDTTIPRFAKSRKRTRSSSGIPSTWSNSMPPSAAGHIFNNVFRRDVFAVPCSSCPPAAATDVTCVTVDGAARRFNRDSPRDSLVPCCSAGACACLSPCGGCSFAFPWSSISRDSYSTTYLNSTEGSGATTGWSVSASSPAVCSSVMRAWPSIRPIVTCNTTPSMRFSFCEDAPAKCSLSDSFAGKSSSARMRGSASIIYAR
eukprot:Opistho-2@323